MASGITAPGEHIVLMTPDGSALFVWIKQKYTQNKQTGVNCAVFRNEGGALSSDLILEAEHIAWRRWPGERLFTYVNTKTIKSKNPGYCYKVAGWKECGTTRGGLIILEKYPNDN